eukprot:1153109-Pelagomonas_calceolata.AAC.11
MKQHPSPTDAGPVPAKPAHVRRIKRIPSSSHALIVAQQYEPRASILEQAFDLLEAECAPTELLALCKAGLQGSRHAVISTLLSSDPLTPPPHTHTHLRGTSEAHARTRLVSQRQSGQACCLPHPLGPRCPDGEGGWRGALEHSSASVAAAAACRRQLGGAASAAGAWRPAFGTWQAGWRSASVQQPAAWAAAAAAAAEAWAAAVAGTVLASCLRAAA